MKFVLICAALVFVFQALLRILNPGQFDAAAARYLAKRYQRAHPAQAAAEAASCRRGSVVPYLVLASAASLIALALP